MNRSIKFHILSLAGVYLFLTGCSFTARPEDSDLTAVDFNSFSLDTTDNPGLLYSVEGRMDDAEVLLEYPDTYISGYQWIPRFDTEAVSVEVDGQTQTSAVTSQNFDTPLTYTLTAASGLTRQIRVELLLQPGWRDLVTSPVQAAGSGVYNIRTGFHQELNPFVFCRDSSLTLRAYVLDTVSSTWNEYNTGAPANVLTFDTLPWSWNTWVMYENTSGSILAQSMVSPSSWSSAHIVATGTLGTQDLRLFKKEDDRMFASWIEDAYDTRIPKVWTSIDGSSWSQVGPDLSSFHAENFAAVSAGGMELYGVCTFVENPGVLHYFKFDLDSDSWEMTQDGGNLNKEDSSIILDLFYDTDLEAPVVFTAVPLLSDAGYYQVRALYWSDSAGVWTNLNYIQPLIINAGDLLTLSIDWYENRPIIAAGQSIKTWDNGIWSAIGSDYTSDTPVLQSVSQGVLNTTIAAYTSDMSGGSMIVRYFQ
jgi:hypothetical protein